MKLMISIAILVFACRLSAQVGESENVGQTLLLDVALQKLATRLQDGISKLRAAEKVNDQEVLLEAYLELGTLYEEEKYFSKALSFFQQAASLANDLGRDAQRLDIETRISRDLYQNGQLEEAYDACLNVLEQHQIFRQYNSAMEDLKYLAETSLSLGNYPRAMEYYSMAREMSEQTEDKQSVMTALNNLGFTASRLEKYEEAIQYFLLAQQTAEEARLPVPGYIYTNLGIAWHNQGNDRRSIESLNLAEAKEQTNKSYVQHLISSIYLKDKDLYNALRFNEQAVKSAKKSNDMQVLSDAYETASEVYQRLYEYDKALDYYKKHLALKDSLLRLNVKEKQYQQNVHSFLDETENSLRQNLIESELRLANLNQLELEAQTQKLETEKRQRELDLLKQEKATEAALLRATQLESERTKSALQLATQQLLAEKQQREIAELNQQRQIDSLDAARQAATQEHQIKELENQKEVAALKAKQEANFRQAAYGVGFLGLLFLLFISGSWLYSKRLNKRLAQQNHQIESQKEVIEKERNRAENLLLNILPQSVAGELKSKGEATPHHFKAATVLFTDFEGFTRIASLMHPKDVVKELNDCFLAFDEIAEKYNLEKIKTIGDSYMCAGGIPLENNTHPMDAVSAAIEIRDFINQRNLRLAGAGLPVWPIRIGIHTGEVVAGVVGKKKFAYDIWGDTVNVASRMESNAGAGQINISDATYRLVHNTFKCTYRGEVDVKNKGKMGMYIVNERMMA